MFMCTAYKNLTKKAFYHAACLSLVTIGLHLAGACAQVKPLEGGPMDTIPPQLLHSVPLHQSTNFQQQELILAFDKEIEVQDIYNRLVITPRLNAVGDMPSYSYTVRGKTLKLKLHSPLQEATTYTFNFKDAIKDTKEGTPAENLTLTFSTGNHVDAMYVTGRVKYLMTDQAAKNVLVSLYKVADPDTLHILNSQPDYFTKTNESGYFELAHIKEGAYRIYAGQSQENKLTIDPSKEPYGFLEEPLHLNQPIEDLTMAIVEADISKFSLNSHKPQGAYFELAFSKPVVNYTLALIQQHKRFKKSPLYSNLIEQGKVIRVYNTLGLLEEDSLEASLIAADAMGNVWEDTVSIHFKEGISAKEPFQYTLTPLAGTKLEPAIFEGQIVFNKPLKNLQKAPMFFVINEKDTCHLSAQNIDLNVHHDTLTIQKQFSPSLFYATSDQATKDTLQQSLTLHITQGAFVSVEKEVNENASYPYFLKQPQECGTIKGKVTTQAPGFSIQLLNEQYEIVAAIHNQSDYEFNNVLPGNYKLRILGLQAKDAKWNFGNLEKRIPPDPVVFYPHELSIVPNWELDYIDLEF